MFQKLKLAKARLAVGYTGVAAVFLSALAYLVQISTNPAAVTLPLTLTFLVLNFAAWWLGGEARANQSTERFGLTLLILGDILVLLNFYALFFLYVPLFQGEVSKSLSAALLAGIVYHLYWYLPPARLRFPAPFYAYFFTLAGGAILYLTRFTLSQSPGRILLMFFGYAAALHILVVRAGARPRGHFSLAIMLLLMAVGSLPAPDFLAQRSGSFLLFSLAATAILWSLAWTARGDGPICRILGFGWYGALTATLTACLYYWDAPAAVYLIATSIWVCALAAQSAALADDKFEPFAQPAYWLMALLGLGVIAYWWPFWSLLGQMHFSFPLRGALALPFFAGLEQSGSWLAPITLATVSGAFLATSIWKRRYPAIALSMWGYAVNYGLVTITSYLPLLLFAAVGSGLWLAFGGGAYGLALTPFVLGLAYISSSQAEDSLYPTAALRIAGYAAIFVSALTALYNTELALAALGMGALVFLKRGASEESCWAHLSFLVMTTGATLVAAFKLMGQDGMLLAALLAVSLLGGYHWLLRWESRAASRLTFVWAMALAGATGVIEVSWGRSPVLVFFVIWCGFLVAPGDLLWQEETASEGAAKERDRWLKIIGYWLGHAAGAVCLISTLKACGIPGGYAGAAVAGWAWLHFAVSRLGTTDNPRQSGVMAGAAALKHSVHGFVLLSVAHAALYSSAEVLVACLLGGVALYFQMARALAEEPESSNLTSPPVETQNLASLRRWQLRGLRLTGYVLAMAAAAVAVMSGAKLAFWGFSASALVFLWRSGSERSFVAHLWFLAMIAAVAGYGLLDQERGLLVGGLAIGLLAIYRWLLTRQGRYSEGRLTLIWAIALAATAGIVEGIWGQFSALVYLLIWVGPLIGLRGRGARPGWESETAAEQQDGRLRIVGYGVAHASGAALLISAMKLAGWPVAYASAALAIWAWVYFGAFQMLAGAARNRVATLATRYAVHGLALAAVALAAFHVREETSPVVAAFLIGLLYLTLRLAWGQEALEDAAALAFIAAFSLLGMKWGIALPDYYLSLLGLYLCFVLHRRTRRKPAQQESVMARAGRAMAFDRDNLLTGAVVGILVAYPFWSLMQTLRDAHLFFLGGGTVLLLYLFMKARQHPLFVYLVCLLFVVGAVYLLAFGHPNQWVNLFLAVVGPLVIANQVFAGNLAPKKLPG